ncbi:MAG TPA: hypothetical protein VKA49_12215 [Flavitalea sp.]|nr:hypothetical protein [Flavitalea sp.]
MQNNFKRTNILKTVSITLMLFCISTLTNAQKPRDGTYTYSIAWAEWGGKTMGATCTVIIRGNTIKVVHDGRPNVTGQKGDIYAQGIIMKHTKTGKWIIGQSKKDKDAKEIGGCSDGPSEIDFKNKKFWSC